MAVSPAGAYLTFIAVVHLALAVVHCAAYQPYPVALAAGLLAMAPLGREVLRRQVVFIDLAVAHQATLYSKDKYVLALKNRLARLGIVVVSLN